MIDITPLQFLGLKYNTDKHDINHTHSNKSYLDEYEEYFLNIKDDVKTVFEIGVLNGSSLKMWEEYFKNADIWGLDINPESNKYYGERIRVITGSQIDKFAINNIAPNQNFDIVIDDGSHLVDHIIESFNLIFPRVKSGGFYIIEDLGCTYGDNTPLVNIWPGQKFNPPETNFQNDRNKLNNFFMDLIHNMDARYDMIRSVKFTYSQCFIKKI